LGAVIVTVCLLVPVTLYRATWVAPVQTTFVLQLKAPVREIPTVALAQVPGFKVMVPRSRFWRDVKVSGLTTLAVTEAFCVTAAAGAAQSAAGHAAASANIRARLLIAHPAAHAEDRSFRQNG
jgi:hypothetical protein